MRKLVLMVGLIATLLVASGCSMSPVGSSTPSPSQSQTLAIPTVAPSLIPTSDPATLVGVDPTPYLTDLGSYLFKVGDGPAWCTIAPKYNMTLCEQTGMTAQYPPVPIPDSCQYSEGYQVQLWDTPPTDGGPQVFFPCASGPFMDPINAPILASGQSMTVGAITCYVKDVTARCDSPNGAFIAFGPKVWALSSAPN